MGLDTIFANIPVKNLEKSIEFYSRLGFAPHPVFRGEGAACMCVSEHMNIMLQTEEHIKRFTTKPLAAPATSTGAILCLHSDSPAHVDGLVRKATDAGGCRVPPARAGSGIGAARS